MLKISRFVALFVAMMFIALPAFSESAAPTFSLMGLEETETPRPWDDSLFFPRMAEITGVSFSFQQFSNAQAYQQAKDEAFKNDTLPDVFFKASLTPAEEMAYSASGQLVDLAPYLQEHAPNFYAILEARPDWRAIITQPDGTIASLPILNGAERQGCFWVNKSWLETLSLDMPTTIDEYTEVLRAFRDRDPNQNGKADEVPLSLVGPWETKFLLHAWGLVPNDYYIFVDDTGTVQYAPFAEGFRDYVEWLYMAHDEGLLDPSTFRSSQSARSATATSTESDAPITIGSMLTTAPYTLINMDNTTDYAVLPPLAHEGKQMYRKLLNGVGRGAFAITKECDDVPAALRWVDYLYTEEGGRLAFAGLEGEDYIINPNGTWAWNVQGDYLLLTELVDRSIIAGDTVTPGLEPAAFMRNSEIAADNYARRQIDSIRDTLVEPFPVTWPTNAARDQRIEAMQTELATYLDTAISYFAMGKTELTDDNWQAMLDELNALGAAEFVSLWQQVYDEVK